METTELVSVIFDVKSVMRRPLSGRHSCTRQGYDGKIHINHKRAYAVIVLDLGLQAYIFNSLWKRGNIIFL